MRPVLGAAILSSVTVVWPCLGAEERAAIKAAPEVRELSPGALRPGGTLGVRPAAKVDAAKKLFLRLDGPGPTEDIPLEATKLERGRFQVVLPKELRQGKYRVQIVDEAGSILHEVVKPLRILATERPVITKVVPHPSYPSDGVYSFEIFGENLGHDVEDDHVTVKINDEPITFAKRVNNTNRQATIASCERMWPCLVGNRRTLQIFRLAPEKHGLFRPLNVTIQVDSLVSEPTALLLSTAQRRTPGFIAFAVLALLGVGVFLMARAKADRYRPFGKRYPTIAYLFIDPESNTLSLSRLQLILWTGAAVVACVYVAASQSLVQWKWELPTIPEGLAPLLGLSVATTALAVGATEARGSKGAGPAHPGLGDFITSGGILAPERLQFFVWTILGVVGFVGATLNQDPATVTHPPKIPENFLPLMGVSSLGYLAGKVVRKPGPIIKQLVPPPPYAAAAPPAAGIRIVGDNISPRAQVWINGAQVPAAAVSVPAPPATAEFVTELAVDAAALAAAIAAAAAAPPPAAAAGAAAPASRVPAVKVTNPDGQSAEL